ncbi:MAG: RDD family protein [Myxococcota bacterium]
MVKDSADPRDRVTDTAFHIAPALLDAELASPWRRGCALLVDFILASIVSALGGAGIAGALAGFFLYRMVGGRRAFGPGWIRKPVAFFMAVSVFAMVKGGIDDEPESPGPGSGSIPPVVATANASGAEVPDWAKIEVNVGGEAVPLSEFMEGLPEGAEDRESSLLQQLEALEEENEVLREQVDSPSLLSSVLALASDLGLTLGWVGAYFTLALAWFGGYTPGKRMMKIRVYRLDGSAISLWWAFERFGGYAAGLATGLLGFAQVFWDPNRQAIQDRIAGTVVVRMRTRDVPRYVDIKFQGTT